MIPTRPIFFNPVSFFTKYYPLCEESAIVGEAENMTNVHNAYDI